MSFLESLAERAERAESDRELRSLENPEMPISSSGILKWLYGGSLLTKSAQRVTPANAVQMTAVFRSAALLAGVGASIPLRTTEGEERQHIAVPLLLNPNPGQTDFELWETAIGHLALWGNAYLLKRRDGRGAVRELWPLFPDRVEVRRVDPSPDNPSGKVFLLNTNKLDRNGAPLPQELGDREVLTPQQVMHIPGFGYDGVRGLSPIGWAREAVGASLSMEKYANLLWDNGALAAGILTSKQKIDDPKADSLQQRWQDMMVGLEKAHRIAVLDQGADFRQLSIPPEDAQYIESRKFQVIEIARLYGIPPHLLAEVERSTSWGTGIEQQNLGFVTYTLTPGYLRRIERRVKKELLGPKQAAEFAVQALLRGDAKTRAEYYQIMVELGVLDADEVRDLENFGPRGGGIEIDEPA